jgi:pyruvate/2-oxoglutarate dehydrogenase complex dihydrolipoamide dehydrogenase (E3) component
MAFEKIRNLIIGSGEGGKCLAWHFGSLHEPTVVIERRWIGGSCPNVNCLPSKNEIWSAKIADLVQHAKAFGVNTQTPTVDMAAVRERKRRMVDGLIKIHVDKYKASGVPLVMGQAAFIAPMTVEVKLNEGGTRTIEAERMFLNLGTRATIPPVPGLLEARPLTHIELLELDRVPEHLIVIGGGYVGLEFAQAYRRFGSRVTVVQRGPHLLGEQDEDLTREVLAMMTDAGINAILSASIISVSGLSGDRITLKLSSSAGEQTIDASDVLVATGRTPNTANIGLDRLGVAVDSHGYLKVNERLETTAPGVWGVGECAGTPQFTHASYDDYRIIRDNLAGGSRSTKDRLMPSCLYTDPPVAQIGLTETEAGQRGIAVRIVKIPMAAVLRTRTLDETRGFMKALIDPTNNRVLGFTMIGPDAGEVMAVVQIAMMMQAPFTTLRDAVLAHPTMAEGLNVLFASVQPRADT